MKHAYAFIPVNVVIVFLLLHTVTEIAVEAMTIAGSFYEPASMFLSGFGLIFISALVRRRSLK